MTKLKKYSREICYFRRDFRDKFHVQASSFIIAIMSLSIWMQREQLSWHKVLMSTLLLMTFFYWQSVSLLLLMPIMFLLTADNAKHDHTCRISHCLDGGFLWMTMRPECLPALSRQRSTYFLTSPAIAWGTSGQHFSKYFILFLYSRPCSCHDFHQIKKFSFEFRFFCSRHRVSGWFTE